MVLPKALVEAATRRTLVPFVGAGFSMMSGLPSWSDLMEGLVRRLDLSPAVREVGHELRHPDFADLLDSLAASERQIISYFLERIDDPRIAADDHHFLLCRLDPLTVLTTNWDNLLESSFRTSGRRARVITDDQSVAEFSFTERTNLVKLHGSIERPESLVYRKSHYHRYWETRPALSSLVRVLSSTQNLLFLGYGLGDPNIHALLETVYRDLGRLPREHWRLQFNEGPLDDTWRRLGVTSIDARQFDSTGDYGRATRRFLAELLEAMGDVALTNLERSATINRELERHVVANRRGAVLRMRGSLGWLSNPEPDPNLVIYGSAEQDAEEFRMTELLRTFLSEGNGHRLMNILNLSGRELLVKYSPAAAAARLKAFRTNASDFGDQVQIALTAHPSSSNEMIFDDEVVIIGHKLAQRPGIGRVFVERDKRVVQRHIDQFDADFKDIVEATREVTGATCGDVVTRELAVVAASFDPAVQPKPLSIIDALHFARNAHDSVSQTRDDGVTPYWVHPMRVALLLDLVVPDASIELLAGALLHDVVEDTAVSAEDVELEFGPIVGGIVRELTAPDGTFEEYLAQLGESSPLSQTVKIADRLDNVTELLEKRYTTFGGWTPAQYADGSRRLVEACVNADGELLRMLTIVASQIDGELSGDGWATQ